MTVSLLSIQLRRGANILVLQSDTKLEQESQIIQCNPNSTGLKINLATTQLAVLSNVTLIDNNGCIPSQ